MENKLRNLYTLQNIDSNLDELEEMKGDLPAEIGGLEDRANELRSHKTALEESMRNAFAMRDGADSEILSLKEKVERYKSQQYTVRNNREYDALTKEMDSATETIARLEKEMDQLEGKATTARNDIAIVTGQLEELNKVLEEKRAALAEVSRANEAEEEKYRHDRQKLVVRIPKADLATYERIRKAKRGKAIVSVKRGACGGCYNRVPPQMILELRQNNRLFMCEHCGRILVSDEIVESASSGA
ncbi:MAG: Zn-ribbon protein [Bacteroidetes bacterium]|nr:Zn-ribbon protein [Bacteroidota bacterium]